MPKKRFTSQYSKPQSTVHPSLNSNGASSSSSSRNDARPSVNELISSLRRSQAPTDQRGTSPAVTPTLPPQIRHLLSLPETPSPKPRVRDRRRFDADGRRIPAGPAAPRSWTESRHAPEVKKGINERLHPSDVNELPGLEVFPKTSRTGGTPAAESDEKSLRNTCLRQMATDWEFIREYERNNLAGLPTRLRMQLLSNIAVYGPEDGIGFEGLKSVVMFPEEEEEPENLYPVESNDEFYRMDLSGSVGRSISFKQLIDLVETPVQQVREEPTDLSWEDSLTRSLTPRIPCLTHLSLSHPPSTISWPKLLKFSKYIPTLTHLSLAHWPVPCLTPNSKSTVVSSKFGKDIQYGGTNYYSHSLDNDFSEATSVLRRLANSLYDLEYLDLTGCTSWVRALLWKEDREPGLEWGSQWLKMKELKVRSGIILTEKSESWELYKYVTAFQQVSLVRLMMNKERRGIKKGGWIELIRDDYRDYEGLWRGSGEEEANKRKHLDSLNGWEGKEQYFHETVLATGSDHVVRSIWDQ